jgi:hypothetical protein
MHTSKSRFYGPWPGMSTTVIHGKAYYHKVPYTDRMFRSQDC